MTGKHLKQVIDIERKSYQEPWDLLEFSSKSHPDRIRMVFTIFNEVAGYCVASEHDDGTDILNLTVWEHLRRIRIGSQLLYAVVSSRTDDRTIAAYPAADNEPAQLFMKSVGFTCRGSHYQEGEEYLEFTYGVSQWTRQKNRIAPFLLSSYFHGPESQGPKTSDS